MTSDTREQFEAHFKLSARQAKRDNAGEYIDEKVRDKWEGWQAAKAVAEKDVQPQNMITANPIDWAARQRGEKR